MAENKDYVEKNKLYFIGGLFVFSIGIIFLFFWQIRFSVNFPYQEMFRVYGKNENDFSVEDKDLNQILIAQNSDTDHDGLTDYKEVYEYQTSPYLEDSDSDGSNDYQEIKGKSDPNCAKGDSCESAVIANYKVGDVSETGNLMFKGAVVSSLRQTLIQSGISEEELSQISDDDLYNLYLKSVEGIPGAEDNQGEAPAIGSNVNNEAIKSLNSSDDEQTDDEQILPIVESVNGADNQADDSNNQAQTKKTTYDLTQEQKDYFINMTPDEIRTLLQNSGLEDELLNDISDEQLRSIYLKTLQTQL